MNDENRPLIFGEVLFDCFPDGKQVLGGAPFNVAWNLKALGLNPYFISAVGDDGMGEKILSAMTTWGMDTSGIQIDDKYPTGTVQVRIENNEPSYEIVNHRAWDYIQPATAHVEFNPALIYHGSLALRNTTSSNTLEHIKQLHASSRLFVDINLRTPWWDQESVYNLVCNSQMVKINEEELSLIVTNQNSIESRIAHLLEHSSIETLVVTMGSAGAIAHTNSNEQFKVTPRTNSALVDTVGAGDAFSSILILGTVKQWPLQQTLERAQKFASAVVGIRGATSTDKAFYSSFSEKWNR